MGQTDAARALQAEAANQGVDMSLEQANTALRQDTNFANQSAINARAMAQAGLTQDAGLFSATAQNEAARRQAELAQEAEMANQAAELAASERRAAASTSLANVGALTQNLGFTAADELRGLGEREREFLQAQRDAIRNLPLEQQQIINAALGLTPAGGAGTVSSGSSRQFSLLA
jgi:hypothetical protein